MNKLFFVSEVKSFDDNELTIEHFISTERRDRSNDIMIADGMFMTGKPVVLLGHGYTSIGAEPIAKPLSITKSSFNGVAGLLAKTKFFDDETGRRLYQKSKQGYMPNWSIGYDPKEFEDGRDDKGQYRKITKWELLEYSIVGVPMNPDAQTLSADKILCKDGSEHKADCEKSCGIGGIKFGFEKKCSHCQPETEIKKGAMISKKNKALINSAIEQLESCKQALGALIQADEKPEDITPETEDEKQTMDYIKSFMSAGIEPKAINSDVAKEDENIILESIKKFKGE